MGERSAMHRFLESDLYKPVAEGPNRGTLWRSPLDWQVELVGGAPRLVVITRPDGREYARCEYENGVPLGWLERMLP